ncbi:MAG TPA: hypothetical protein VM733_21530 [Thermoanaerobaculia bacterium]|nr:hypothetical protein [Thermoanaerobaculia bacterium]
MRRLALVLLIALPALADGYSFHLRVTDGKTALLANPAGAPPQMQPDAAAKTRVLSFERVKGAHFQWMMLGWPEEKKDVSYLLNDRGGAKEVEKADIAIAPLESGAVAITCHRSRCAVHVSDGGDRRADATLTKGQTADFPLNADFKLEFEP